MWGSLGILCNKQILPAMYMEFTMDVRFTTNQMGQGKILNFINVMMMCDDDGDSQ